MSECDEVARGIAQYAPRFASFTEALTYVRRLMRGEGETIMSNVAWSLWRAQKEDPCDPSP